MIAPFEGVTGGDDPLDRAAAAVSQSQSRVVSTVSLLVKMRNNSFTGQLGLLEAVDWGSIDANLEMSNGLSFHAQLLSMLQSAAAANWTMKEVKYRITGSGGRTVPELVDVDQSSRFASMQPAIVAKLLERNSTMPSDPSRCWSHPLASAAELLRHLILELSISYSSKIASFIAQLIATLHGLGFDLDSRDARGRMLLLEYARKCRPGNGDTTAVVKQLLQLGASPSVRDQEGGPLLFAWVECDRHDLLMEVLSRRKPWSELGVQLDVWERDSQGRTLLEIEAAKGESLLTMSLEELQRHWLEQERPLYPKLLLAHTPLIRDVANIVLKFVDGLDQHGQPLKEPVKPAEEP